MGSILIAASSCKMLQSRIPLAVTDKPPRGVFQDVLLPWLNARQ